MRATPEFLAERIDRAQLRVPPGELQGFVSGLARELGGFGAHSVPEVVLDVVRTLLAGHSADTACDPWADLGVLAATVHDVTNARKTFANEPLIGNLPLAQALTPQLEWRAEDALAFLAAEGESFDVVASVLPMGLRLQTSIEFPTKSGDRLQLSGEMGAALLVAASLQLSATGIGLFVVTPSFFFARGSLVEELPQLGLCIAAALELPAGSLAPATNIPTFLVVVRKKVSEEMFVAQLSQDSRTNRQIIDNLREGRADGPLELGRLVAAKGFRGLDSLRLGEQLTLAEQHFEVRAVRLGELTQSIRLGRPGEDFEFPETPNALYIPLIGISDVLEGSEVLTLKRQNYAQVAIDQARTDARFVARFLNSSLGRSVREATKTGIAIRKLNTAGLKDLQVLIPNLETQKRLLEVDARLAAERNTLLGLQNDVAALQRELWANPRKLADVDDQIQALASQLAKGATPHASSTLEQWFETLPFPLASILRAWQASNSREYKARYEHLLHFFEATAEFLSVIYLSAFSSQPVLFEEHKEKLIDALQKQHLSLERSTFGTWKVIVEYLSKQTRSYLFGDPIQRKLCLELFYDESGAFPEMLSGKDLVAVLAAANKLRNDWTGHGGMVGEGEAKERNEQLVGELQRLRQSMKDVWQGTRLIRAIHCRPSKGRFDNEVAILVGSNSEFLKESRAMAVWLDVERLYLISKDSDQALLLLPLMHVGASPESAKNACYFFNRVEKDGARFISYHFADYPEWRDKSRETAAAIRILTATVDEKDP